MEKKPDRSSEREYGLQDPVLLSLMNTPQRTG
jgi:hypothetical protein